MLSATYFGKNVMTWLILTDYRLSDKYFDIDVDNCFLLSNEELAILLSVKMTRKYLSKLQLAKEEEAEKKKKELRKNKSKKTLNLDWNMSIFSSLIKIDYLLFCNSFLCTKKNFSS